MAANNSCGQRSIRYGTMRDNVIAIDAVLPSGESFCFNSIDQDFTNSAGSKKALADKLLDLGSIHAETIQARFPKVQRRVGGYNLDALATHQARNTKQLNLAEILVGSEGTLAYTSAIELKLCELPNQRVLGVCHFPSFYQAMDATQHLVKLKPHAIELVDNNMIELARDIDLYKSTINEFVQGSPAALLLVEFACETQQENVRQLELLDDCMSDLGFYWQGSGNHWGGVVRAIDPVLQARIGDVRKAGLNIMMSMKSEGKPVSFVEDCAVELQDLADYTAGLTEIFRKHGTQGTWYAHASVGCLHVRPVLNMKLEKDATTMRAIADEAFDLVLKYKGSHSGEHGDGISRSEFHQKMFGSEIVGCFEQIKQLFDPDNLFNPGKIVNAPRMNDRSLFRYQPDYKFIEIQQQLDWSEWSGANGGLQGAIEMCNNNGACRKLKGGVMCPSYRVTRNEQDVTRGRANALRLALSGQLGENALVSDAMQDSMKLCVSCKACKLECPTGVDMAKMKLEVQSAHARKHGYSLQQKIIANLPRYAPLAYRLRWLFNLRNTLPWLAKLSAPISGFAPDRKIPTWAAKPFLETPLNNHGDKDVVLLCDTFNKWFEPDNLRSAINVLQAAGYNIHIAASQQRKPLCCGRTYMASGMLEQARIEARNMVNTLLPWVKKDVPIVGLEPSCLLTLRDEYKALIPGAKTDQVAAGAYLLEELILRDHHAGALKWRLNTFSDT